MFKNRLRRYTGLIVLMTLLISFVVTVIIGNSYVDTQIIQRDYFSASRTVNISQLVPRLGLKDQQLRRDMVAHIRMVRDGGDLISDYGPRWQVSPSSNQQIINAINSIEVAVDAGDLAAAEKAYLRFSRISAEAGFAALARLEVIQYVIVGIIVLGFLSVLGLLFFRLGRADDRALKITSENNQILSALADGLFLIDSDLQISEQKSDAVNEIFGKQTPIEGDFFNLMREFISPANVELAREFIDLLFEGRVLQDLMQDLNPLQEVEVNVSDESGAISKKYLNFNFSRDDSLSENSSVLVSVSDVTKEVVLRRELETTKTQQKERMNLFVGMLHVDPRKLIAFCDQSAAEMGLINSQLADDDLGHFSMMNKLDDIFRRAHKIKGDASALGLTLFENSLHRFENELEALKKMPVIDGRNILDLTVQLKDMINETEVVRGLLPQLEALSLQPQESDDEEQLVEPDELEENVPTPSESMAYDLQELVDLVSTRQGKKAVVDVSGLEILDDKPELLKQISSICVQLVRNSVVHGIEAPQKRINRDKTSFGVINVSLKLNATNEMALIVRDDGKGLQFQKIKEKALQTKLLKPSEADKVHNRAMLKFLFMPGFSSVDETTVDAGRGVGLNYVRSEIVKLGGRVQVSSKDGRYTKFVLNVPVAA